MAVTASACNEASPICLRVAYVNLVRLCFAPALALTVAANLPHRVTAQVVEPVRGALPPEVIRSPQPNPNVGLPPPHGSFSGAGLSPDTATRMAYPGAPPGALLEGPILTDSGPRPPFPPASVPPTERPFPINLATALRLSNGRPLIIAAAQARVQIAAAQLEQANVLWLPTANGGVDYIRHGGGKQDTRGDLLVESTNSFIAGGSAILRVATTDAVFNPLAARQVLRSRQIDTQAARNLALKKTAESYFDVQVARGTYAAMTDATLRATELVRRVKSLAGGLVAPDEINRAETLLAALEQSTQSARQAAARLQRRI